MSYTCSTNSSELERQTHSWYQSIAISILRQFKVSILHFHTFPVSATLHSHAINTYSQSKSYFLSLRSHLIPRRYLSRNLVCGIAVEKIQCPLAVERDNPFSFCDANQKRLPYRVFQNHTVRGHCSEITPKFVHSDGTVSSSRQGICDGENQNNKYSCNLL
jgi:hypothetical protein